MKKNIFIFFIIMCFMRGYISNNFGPLKYSWDLSLFIFQILLFPDFLKALKDKNIFIAYVFFLASFLISTINSLYFNDVSILYNCLLEFMYINGYWIVICVLIKSKGMHRSIWRLIFFLSSIQIYFDLLNIEQISRINETLDLFPGTFFMPNQKSRVLALFLLCLFILIKERKEKISTLYLLNIITIIISYIIGFSDITYVLLGLSVLVALIYIFYKDFRYKNKISIKRKILIFLISLASVLFVFFKYIKAANFGSMYIIYTERFFNPDSGVYGMILYSFRLILESSFLGTGGGTFMGRTATSLGSSILENAPSVQVAYGTFTSNTTIDGVSGLLNISVEYGILGLISFILLLRIIFKNVFSNKILMIVVSSYIIFIILYTPYFFDNEFGFISTIIFVLLKKFFENPVNNFEKDRRLDI